MLLPKSFEEIMNVEKYRRVFWSLWNNCLWYGESAGAELYENKAGSIENVVGDLLKYGPYGQSAGPWGMEKVGAGLEKSNHHTVQPNKSP